MQKIIIAIDGHSSCGKSTVAKALAKSLGYTYIDTGAMYRAITLYFLRHHINFADKAAVVNALDHIHLAFVKSPNEDASHIYLNGVDVEQDIRTLEVASRVSPVAAIAEVRTFLVKQQQEMGKARGVVMDGRDIGTVVFPDAELKVFMTADAMIRAERRCKELISQGQEVRIEEVYHNLMDRDRQDTERVVNPLRKAEDAVEIDTSHITRVEQFNTLLDLAKIKIKNIL